MGKVLSKNHCDSLELGRWQSDGNVGLAQPLPLFNNKILVDSVFMKFET